MKYLWGNKWLRWATYLSVGTVYLFSCAALMDALQKRWFPSESFSISGVRLDSNERMLLTLAGVGTAIAFGKLLVGGEKVTLRLIVGRLIIGAALSMAAATVLMMIPNVPPMALVGLGSALGILGQSFLEKLVQRYWTPPHKTDE